MLLASLTVLACAPPPPFATPTTSGGSTVIVAQPTCATGVAADLGLVAEAVPAHPAVLRFGFDAPEGVQLAVFSWTDANGHVLSQSLEVPQGTFRDHVAVPLSPDLSGAPITLTLTGPSGECFYEAIEVATGHYDVPALVPDGSTAGLDARRTVGVATWTGSARPTPMGVQWAAVFGPQGELSAALQLDFQASTLEPAPDGRGLWVVTQGDEPTEMETEGLLTMLGWDGTMLGELALPPSHHDWALSDDGATVDLLSRRLDAALTDLCGRDTWMDEVISVRLADGAVTELFDAGLDYPVSEHACDPATVPFDSPSYFNGLDRNGTVWAASASGDVHGAVVGVDGEVPIVVAMEGLGDLAITGREGTRDLLFEEPHQVTCLPPGAGLPGSWTDDAVLCLANNRRMRSQCNTADAFVLEASLGTATYLATWPPVSAPELCSPSSDHGGVSILRGLDAEGRVELLLYSREGSVADFLDLVVKPDGNATFSMTGKLRAEDPTQLQMYFLDALTGG